MENQKKKNREHLGKISEIIFQCHFYIKITIWATFGSSVENFSILSVFQVYLVFRLSDDNSLGFDPGVHPVPSLPRDIYVET